MIKKNRTSMTGHKIWLCAIFSLLLAAIGLSALASTNAAYAASTPKYVLCGSIRYVANLPYNAGYSGNSEYTIGSAYYNSWAVYLYGDSYGGETAAYQNNVFNFSYLRIEAQIKKNQNPHNGNFYCYHQSYSLKNNTTGATVASGSLSNSSGSKTLVATTLSDGYYTLTYVAGGGGPPIAGGMITDTMTYNFYIDTTPPSYSLKAGGAEIASGSYTNSLVTYSASDTRFSQIYYKKPSASSYTATASTSYAVSATSANNGWWYFYSTDTVGNKSATASIYIDTVAPVGTITCNGATTASGSYTNKAFSYKATDSGGVKNCEYKTPSSSSWTNYVAGTQISTTAVNGWYYFRARDHAGQYSTEQSIYLDSGKPMGILYAGGRAVTSGTVTNAEYISFTGSDSQSGLNAVYVKKPDSNQYVQAANGSQYVMSGTYSFYCTDKAGTTSDTYSITLDKTAPELVCKETEFGALTNKGFTVTATDNSGTATLYYRYENEEWKTQGNSYSVSNGARDGKYSFYAKDPNSNQTAVVWIVLSTATPEGKIIKSDYDNSLFFTWNNEYWSATLDGKAYSKGVWITEEGEHTVVIANSIGISSTYTFTIDHDYKVKEIVPSTCTEQGYTQMECSQCGKTEEVDYVKVLGHNYVETASPPTCTESGKRLFSCQNCGYETALDGEPAMGHRFDSTVMRKATCTVAGERFHVCAKCEYSYLGEIPALGHQYEITDAAMNSGTTRRTYTCSLCNDSYTQDLGNQYEKVTSYVEYLFQLYSPYMIWVFLGTTGVWSIVLGVMVIIAHKNEDKEKAKKMLVNYIIGLVIIFCILVACPFLIRGIASLVT